MVRVLTTKPLESREFQFVYLCSLLSNTPFIRKQNGSKLHFFLYTSFSKKYFLNKKCSENQNRWP